MQAIHDNGPEWPIPMRGVLKSVFARRLQGRLVPPLTFVLSSLAADNVNQSENKAIQGGAED